MKRKAILALQGQLLPDCCFSNCVEPKGLSKACLRMRAEKTGCERSLMWNACLPDALPRASNLMRCA